MSREQRTLFLMLRARLAYLSVFSVSMKSRSDGEMQAIISVRLKASNDALQQLHSYGLLYRVYLLPPSESCRRRVSFESRYGT